MQNWLVDTILDVLVDFNDDKYEARASHFDYAKLVRQTEDLLQLGELNTPTINHICDRLSVCRRTLHRAFDEELGVTPSIYIRNWRLARARSGLVQGKYNTVTECAIDYGFFDVGRFACYYRRLFDELPSATLAQSQA